MESAFKIEPAVDEQTLADEEAQRRARHRLWDELDRHARMFPGRVAAGRPAIRLVEEPVVTISPGRSAKPTKRTAAARTRTSGSGSNSPAARRKSGVKPAKPVASDKGKGTRKATTMKNAAKRATPRTAAKKAQQKRTVTRTRAVVPTKAATRKKAKPAAGKRRKPR